MPPHANARNAEQIDHHDLQTHGQIATASVIRVCIPTPFHQPDLPCFFGRSTENLWITLRVLPDTVPKREPFPSITMKPNLASDSSSSERASVWNLLSQRYKDVLIGLKGSNEKLTFFSLPSSVRMVPQYTTRPLGGTVGRVSGKDGQYKHPKFPSHCPNPAECSAKRRA